jgi:hypothetical protein
MSDDLSILTISATISVIVGVILAYFITGFGNFWNERKLRQKYSRIFSFELQQLQQELTKAMSQIGDYLTDPEMVFSFPEDTRKEIGMYYPEEALPRYHFKADYAFLRQNFDKISIFQEDTIKSLIKINSLIEEYDIVSKNGEKIHLTKNLKNTQNEIEIAITLLQKEEKMGIFNWENILRK